MLGVRTFAAPLSCILIASAARADFHDWRINEVLSDASGNVQFIEFSNTLENGEKFLTGHTLVSNGGSITFANDLPSDQTLNKFFIVGTDAYANRPGAPAPDYRIPANFLNVSGDTITYAEGTDTLTFGSLPTDGTTSLNRDLTTSTNSPANFAGETGSIDASGPPTGVPLPAAAIPGAIMLLAAAARTRVKS